MKKLNKKGFTLVELLAVIVVLALILVITVPTVLSAMNNSKKKLFQSYGTRIINAVTEEYESQKMLNDVTSKRYNNHPCYTIADLGIKSQGAYVGFVEVIPSSLIGDDNLNKTEYKVYLTDETFAYKGTDSVAVQTTPGDISITQADIEFVKTAIQTCS